MPRRINHGLDFEGNRIPLYLAEQFKTARELSSRITALRNHLRSLAAFEGKPGVDLIDFEEIENGIAYLINLVDHWRPWMICPKCENRSMLRGDCECQGRGWLPLARAPGEIMQRRERQNANRRAGARGVPVALQTVKRLAKKRGLD